MQSSHRVIPLFFTYPSSLRQEREARKTYGVFYEEAATFSAFIIFKLTLVPSFFISKAFIFTKHADQWMTISLLLLIRLIEAFRVHGSMVT